MRHRQSRRAGYGMVLVAILALAGCGEPGVDLSVPDREPGQLVLDHAGILDDEAVATELRSIPNLDVVALTVELEDASLGAADRAGRRLLDEWDADVVLVAVARPDHFSSEAGERERFFGLYAADVRAVSRDLRERIVEQIVPPLAAANDWTGVFVAAAEELAVAAQ